MVLDPVDLGAIHSSALLREAIDEYFFNVWEFYGDGEYPLHGTAKAEVEELVAALIAKHGEVFLASIATADRLVVHGVVGPPRRRRDGNLARIGAFRLLELAIEERRFRLHLKTLDDPDPADRVYRTLPQLYRRLDKRGLLPITRDMIPSGSGGLSDRYLVVEGYAIYPHPFVSDYRELISLLLATASANDVLKVRLAIDAHRLVRADQAVDVLLADYWWGFKLTKENIDDVRAIGHTRHERRRDDVDPLSNLIATDFTWTANGIVKELVVEETVGREAEKGPYVCNRYLHSLRDTARSRFIHLDGAVRAYQASTYAATPDEPAGERGVVERYRKLFRVDGHIDDGLWSEVVGCFYRGNEHLAEYFGESLERVSR